MVAGRAVTTDALTRAALTLLGDRRRVILGVVGAPGAGKSRLAADLVDAVCAVTPGLAVNVPMDGFHLADVQLDRLGLRQRKGAPETFDSAGYLALLHRIRHRPDETIYAPGFERTLEQPVAASIVVEPKARLVVTEGSYLLLEDPAWTAARACLDQTWFVKVPEDTRRARLVDRHVEHGKDRDAAARWVQEVDEPNATLVTASGARADRVVVNSAGGWQLPGGTPGTVSV